MYSKRYSRRHAKINVVTKKISIRGFTRELKSLLLGENRNIFKKAEYSAVTAAYEAVAKEKMENSSIEVSKDFETHLIGSSGYSDWWTGEKYPRPGKRTDIETLIPGLARKWFDRENFKDRFQLHIASLDIFHMSGSCNCQLLDITKDDFQGRCCEECLSEAISDAELILNSIHKDWRPELTSFDTGDVSISGPSKRAISEMSNEQLQSAVDTTKKDRMKIDFDLSLEESSFIGLNFPREIMNSYHDENPYSIVQFLFLLIGLNIKTDCEYRNELILDFMTALNCAALLMLVKHKSIFTNPPEYIENNIQRIVMSISELFYEKPFTLIEQFAVFEDLCVEKRSNPRKDSSIVYPITFFPEEFDGQRFLDEELSSLFLEILMFHAPYWNEKIFMEDVRNRYDTYDHKETEAEHYLSGSRLELFKPFEAAKERYFDQFHFIGYSREELAKELNEMFVNPMGSKVRWKDKSNKKSVYI